MILGCAPIVRQDLGEARRSGEQSQYSPRVKQPSTNETDRRILAPLGEGRALTATAVMKRIELS
jgi:hypothetical protein